MASWGALVLGDRDGATRARLTPPVRKSLVFASDKARQYSEDVAARIDELKLLVDGWMDGTAKAPDNGALDWVQELFETHFPNHLQLPFLYPTPDGGIQAEWSIGTMEITLEIDLTEQTGDWHEYNSESEDEIVRALHFEESDAIAWVVHRIEESQRET